MSASGAPVFVVGIARSGTTLLSSMLTAHSRLDCGPESRFFARLRHLDDDERAALVDEATWPVPAVDFIAGLGNQGHPIIELFGLSTDDIRSWLADRPPSIAAMLESLTVQHAERAGKARWVEKTPRHLLMLETLRELWPDARIVRIVRDPRDVALSLVRMPFATDSVIANLIRVDHDDRISRRFVASDQGTLSLRYEDLLARPEVELRRICDFIGEDFDPDMLASRGEGGAVAAEHEWWKASVSGPIDPSRIGRWRSEMAPEAQRFASVHLVRYLDEHGYEGGRKPRHRVAIVPAGAQIGAKHEGLLVDLAARDTAVVRPAPRHFSDLRRQRRLVYFGLKGQLDPSRNWPVARRLGALVGLVALGLERRIRRRPLLWVRKQTLRTRRATDPFERLTAVVLRVLARPTDVRRVPEHVGLLTVDDTTEGEG